MAYTEQIPNSASYEPQGKLGMMLDEAHTNLSILTTLDLQRSRSEFGSDREFMMYYGELRFRRYASQISQVVDNRTVQRLGFVMDAGGLQSHDQMDWTAALFSPYDAMSPDGGHSSGRYIMNLTHMDPGSSRPNQVVSVDCSDGLDDIGPRLKYWNPQGITSREIIIDNPDMEASYPFHVVTQITEQLKREADALLALALDGVSA